MHKLGSSVPGLVILVAFLLCGLCLENRTLAVEPEVSPHFGKQRDEHRDGREDHEHGDQQAMTCRRTNACVGASSVCDDGDGSI